MILDKKVVTEFHQIVEEPGRNLPDLPPSFKKGIGEYLYLLGEYLPDS